MSIGRTCTICGERFFPDEIGEWRSNHEAYYPDPLICPDCYDDMQRKDPQDLLEELMEAET